MALSIDVDTKDVIAQLDEELADWTISYIASKSLSLKKKTF